MSKEFGMLAHWWDGSFEKVQGTLCSRKYNGWSAIWDGGITTGMLASDVPWYYKGKDKPILSTGLWTLGRENKPKVLQAPKYFTDHLPKSVPAHGEIWYNDRIDIVKRTCGLKKFYSPMWYNLRFIAFNIKSYYLWPLNEAITRSPLFPAMHDIFTCSEALSHLKQFKNEIFDVIDTTLIVDEEILKKCQSYAVKERWEGLMFAQPKSLYELKRSWNNLKWKPEYEYEALIYGHEDGKTGKNIGKVGALLALTTWDNQIVSIYGGRADMIGKEVHFSISGLNDNEREWGVCPVEYPIGKRIKFKFSGVSVHGVPQSPNIYREDN